MDDLEDFPSSLNGSWQKQANTGTEYGDIDLLIQASAGAEALRPGMATRETGMMMMAMMPPHSACLPALLVPRRP